MQFNLVRRIVTQFGFYKTKRNYILENIVKYNNTIQTNKQT